MEINKKQLKQLNEVNKKVKTHFSEEFYIFPNNRIFGKCNNNIDDKTLIIYKLPIETLFTSTAAEILVVYPKALSSIYSQSKTERKIKTSDIGDIIIDKEIMVSLWGGEEHRVIGKVVSLKNVNINTFHSITTLFDIGYNDFEQLSQSDYDKLYDKEMVEYSQDWFTILLNYKIFKTFTHHCQNNRIELKYKKVDEELRIFETVLKFIHVDKKTDRDIMDILIRERGIY